MEFTRAHPLGEVRKVYVKKPFAYVKKTEEMATRTKGAGSAGRNIIRKGKPSDHGNRKPGITGTVVDDGSVVHFESEEFYVLDENDPNYDSQDDDNDHIFSINSSVNAYYNYFKKELESLIDEFFVSGDIPEFLGAVVDLYFSSRGHKTSRSSSLGQASPAQSYHATGALLDIYSEMNLELDGDFPRYELVKRTISKSLDKDEKCKELTSKMLSMAYGDLYSLDDVCEGFDKLLEIMEELEKDCPKCSDDIAKFMARAIYDEILPPRYLSSCLLVCDDSTYPGILEVLEKAKALLSNHHGSSRLDHIWGPGDGRPVAELKVLIDQLLEEYLLGCADESGRVAATEEAIRCIKELNVSYYHHEIIKRGITTVILNKSGSYSPGKGKEVNDSAVKNEQAMSHLFFAMVKLNTITSVRQCTEGFNRMTAVQQFSAVDGQAPSVVGSYLDDLTLDAPHAKAVMRLFVESARANGIISNDYEYC